ncbi:peptidoglycan DD-metalloendopeptidase family protein [Gordonia humi]
MKAQQVNTKFGAVLPHDQIAHKTGELTGTSHDVGWFFDGDRWLSVAILTSKPSGGDQAAGNEIIKKFAKKVFDARKEPVVGGTADRAPPASSSATPSSQSAPADGGAGDGTTMPIKTGDYQLSSPFGPRGGENHQGSDFAAPLGTPIYAAHEGKVAASGPASGFGNWIIVDFNDGKASNVYGHMRAADLKVTTGDTVKAGQQIAAVGNEGQSSGPHLHFELWQGGTRLQGGHAVDPMPWLRGASQPSGSGANVELVGAVDRGTGCGDVATGSTLKPGSVPAEFEPWIIKAGTVCPEISAPLIAAQTHQESGGFQVQATNPKSGAAGPAQFMAATWAAKGVDGDGDGKKDIYSIADSMMSMAHYDCELLGIMRDAMSAGKVHGDLVELTLSAYNCGPGATLAAGSPCQNAETQHYIKIIPARARTVYANPDADTPVSGEGFGGRVVAAAMKWRGTTYAWGGGTGRGPSMGIRDGGVADSFGDFQKIGFDCSGLVIHGVFQASGGTIELPHYTVSQLNDKRGKPVTGGQAKWLPGDILFPAGGNPQHVAIYIGDGKVVEAPQSGDVVKVSPVASAVGANPDARRFG